MTKGKSEDFPCAFRYLLWYIGIQVKGDRNPKNEFLKLSILYQ